MPLTFLKPNKTENTEKQPETKQLETPKPPPVAKKKRRPPASPQKLWGFQISDQLKERIDAHVAKTGATKSEILRRAVVAYLDAQEKK
jgi:hypothetical protein